MVEINITTIVITFLAAMGIPSAVTAFCFWGVQRKMIKRDDQRDELEKARKTNEVLLVKSIGAAIALGEATAIAVRDGKCNGEMTKAMSYAQQIKHEQKDFLTAQGVENLY